MNEELNIQDDQIRVIGSARPVRNPGKPPGKPPRNPLLLWILAVVGVAVFAAVVLLAMRLRVTASSGEDVFGPVEFESQHISFQATVPPVLLSRDGQGPGTGPCVERIDTLLGGIPLQVLIPHGGEPSLKLGLPDAGDPSIILAAQAADVRRDNQGVAGSFVLQGRPLSWGLSEMGYCGIIEGVVRIGLADSSPLFEEATSSGGYFFRQVPLVDCGVPVGNEMADKSIRKALCDMAGEIFMAVTSSRESLRDFSQALVDLGVDNAVCLVDGPSYGFYRDVDGTVTKTGERTGVPSRYENYIVWSVPSSKR